MGQTEKYSIYFKILHSPEFLFWDHLTQNSGDPVCTSHVHNTVPWILLRNHLFIRSNPSNDRTVRSNPVLSRDNAS